MEPVGRPLRAEQQARLFQLKSWCHLASARRHRKTRPAFAGRKLKRCALGRPPARDGVHFTGDDCRLGFDLLIIRSSRGPRAAAIGRRRQAHGGRGLARGSRERRASGSSIRAVATREAQARGRLCFRLVTDRSQPRSDCLRAPEPLPSCSRARAARAARATCLCAPAARARRRTPTRAPRRSFSYVSDDLSSSSCSAEAVRNAAQVTSAAPRHAMPHVRVAVHRLASPTTLQRTFWTSSLRHRFAYIVRLAVYVFRRVDLRRRCRACRTSDRAAPRARRTPTTTPQRPRISTAAAFCAAACYLSSSLLEQSCT